MKLDSMKKKLKEETVTGDVGYSSSLDGESDGGEESQREGCENYVHCALLGDGMVGKTCLTLSYTQHSFSHNYTATVFDNYPVPLEVGGVDFLISLFDTRGHSKHESLRAYTYEKSEVLVLCFSVCDRESFCSVVTSWLPEIRRHVSKPRCRSLLLVGTQIDLRTSSVRPGPDEVSTEEGRQLGQMIGADCYIECSARSQEGLRQVFEHVVFSALKWRRKRSGLLNRLLGHLKSNVRFRRRSLSFSPPRCFHKQTTAFSCC